jgi:hypothetical protein
MSWRRPRSAVGRGTWKPPWRSYWSSWEDRRSLSPLRASVLRGNEIQVASQFFTETSLPTFPYRLRGHAEMSVSWAA